MKRHQKEHRLSGRAFCRVKEIYTDVEKKADGMYHGRKLNVLPFVPEAGTSQD